MKSTPFFVSLVLAFAGCTLPSPQSPDDAGAGRLDGEDAGPADDAGAPPDCVSNPTTNEEIINACTGAQKIEKEPVLPLLRADGSLPPLP